MLIKTINHSDLFHHDDYRWDSEYLCFEPYRSPKLSYVPIRDILLQSQYGISIEMNEDDLGTKIYRMNEISDMFCDRTVKKSASISQEEILKYKLRNNDVLFNRTNSQEFVGRTGIFREFSEDNFVFASYLIRIVPDESKILPEYLTVFLNTKYGVPDIKRRARISINQSNVNAEELKRVRIPLINHKLQKLIREVFDDAFSMLDRSEHAYEDSESMLLEDLKLSNWLPKHRLSFIRKLSAIEQADRFDAEYYQPKYNEIVKAVKGYSGGSDTIGNIVTIRDRNYNPKDKVEYKYVELSNIAGNGEVTGCTIGEGQDLPTRARRQVRTGDVIVSSIEGSLTSIALIQQAFDQGLCSTGFHVVRSNSIRSECLLVLMKSIVGQLQLKKGCSGTILTAINRNEFERIILPIVNDDVQFQIGEKITESFTLREQAIHLLECAKRAVEVAIEQDENTAMQWLKEQTNEN